MLEYNCSKWSFASCREYLPNSMHESFSKMEAQPKQHYKLDELLKFVGEFGRFQILFDIALCILLMPGMMLIFLPYFSQHNPPWKCVANSSSCLLNGTFSLASKSYKARCQMPRTEWEYTEAKEYSVVTQVRIFVEIDSFPTDCVKLRKYAMNM